MVVSFPWKKYSKKELLSSFIKLREYKVKIRGGRRIQRKNIG